MLTNKVLKTYTQSRNQSQFHVSYTMKATEVYAACTK